MLPPCGRAFLTKKVENFVKFFDFFNLGILFFPGLNGVGLLFMYYLTASSKSFGSAKISLNLT